MFFLGTRDLYGDQHRNEIVGIYTMLEESNTIGTMGRTTDLTGHFLEPLARDIKQNISSNLLVWASPYFVANLTRHPITVRRTPASAGLLHAYMPHSSNVDWLALFGLLAGVSAVSSY